MRGLRVALTLAALGGLCGASGCFETRYVLQQGWAQLQVLNGRERIVDVLRRPDLPGDHRTKLAVVLLARAYGSEELGLRRTGAYTRFYDTGGKELAWALSACPPDRLEARVWRFPIVGGVPYLGFFERADGLRKQRQLRARGLDTYLRPVSAYSSLGFFADPVYSPMLEDDIPRLVDLVLHETTHTTIFLRNRVPFNESLAVFVGNQGTLNFLARLYGPTSPRVTAYAARIGRRRRFSRLITALYERLERLYARTDVPRSRVLRRKQELFAWAQARYKEIFVDPDTWGSFPTRELNNAVLLSYGRYNQGIEFHRAVYERVGRDLPRFVSLYKHAQQFDDPIAYVARVCGIRWAVEQIS